MRSRLSSRGSSVPGVVEVLQARITAWGYPPHCHGTWALLVVEDGAIDYRLGRSRHQAGRGSVTILPPDITHDGRPAAPGGSFSKREVYLDTDFLPPSLHGPAVDHTNLTDPTLAAAVRRLHSALLCPDEGVAAEEHLARLATLLTHRLSRGARLQLSLAAVPSIARQLRDLLDDRLTRPPTLAQAAAELDRTVAHLARSFAAEYAISPHAYVIARRIDLARRELLQGTPSARVAADLGFHDQAHFTRHFRRHTSMTPGRFALADGRRRC